jgi:hypothetical protein
MGKIVMKVLGLREGELPTSPCESGILVIEVPGLTAGAATNQGRRIGYIVFVRKSETTIKTKR